MDLTYSNSITPLAKEAGKIALHYFRNTVAMRKEDDSLVTAADREIEAYLKNQFAKEYRDFSFIGEENPPNMKNSPYSWIVDPIDGTTSFASGMPVWSVSIGLLHEDRLVYGCLYLPYLNEMYEAETGKGAFLNRKKIIPKAIQRLHSESILFIPSSAHSDYSIDFKGKIRNLGCTSAHIVYSALGSAAASLQACWIWDIAASFVILQELGGTAVTLDGSTFDFAPYTSGEKETPSFLTGHAGLLDQIHPGIKDNE